MPRRKKKGEITTEAAQQLIEVTAVLLRDHSHIDFNGAILAFSYSWRHTESENQALMREEREKRDV